MSETGQLTGACGIAAWRLSCEGMAVGRGVQVFRSYVLSQRLCPLPRKLLVLHEDYRRLRRVVSSFRSSGFVVSCVRLPPGSFRLARATGSAMLCLAAALSPGWNSFEATKMQQFARAKVHRPGMLVLDVGGRVIPHQYRPAARQIFEALGCNFTSLDLQAHPSVDLVVPPGQPFPFEDGHFEIVITTSTFEHDPMFWMTVREMARVTRVGGWIHATTPHTGHYHAFPGDCWRLVEHSGMGLAHWTSVPFEGRAYPLKLNATSIGVGGSFLETVITWSRTNAPTPMVAASAAVFDTITAAAFDEGASCQHQHPHPPGSGRSTPHIDGVSDGCTDVSFEDASDALRRRAMRNSTLLSRLSAACRTKAHDYNASHSCYRRIPWDAHCHSTGTLACWMQFDRMLSNELVVLQAASRARAMAQVVRTVGAALLNASAPLRVLWRWAATHGACGKHCSEIDRGPARGSTWLSSTRRETQAHSSQAATFRTLTATLMPS